MTEFGKDAKSFGHSTSTNLEEEICDTHNHIKNSFHSAVNAFTVLERKHDEIEGIIKPDEK